jgi:plastocyanin
LRKLIAVAATAAVAAFAAPALAATKTVAVGDNWFVKNTTGTPTVTVKKGTTVKWVWKGDSQHNVHAVSGPATFASALKTSGSFKRKLSKKGTYKLICDKHGAADQSMKLVVK